MRVAVCRSLMGGFAGWEGWAPAAVPFPTPLRVYTTTGGKKRKKEKVGFFLLPAVFRLLG